MSMSLSSDAPSALRALVEAVNAGDRDAFVAAFTEDALLSDRGREYRGHDGIAGWPLLGRIGAGARAELLGVKQGDTETEYVATVLVSDGRASDTTDLAVTLRADRVARLAVPA